MINYRSVVAVVLSSVASFWLAGCAADASSPTGDEQQSPVVTPAGDTKNDGVESGSEVSKTARPLPEIGTNVAKDLTEIRIGEKIDPKGANEQPSDEKYEDSGCDVGGEVECSCGVCAPIWRCVAICETVPQ